MVLDAGDGASHAVPSNDCYSFPRAIMGMYLAGRDMTEWMATILNESGDTFTLSSELSLAREMTNTFAYAACDFEAGLSKVGTEIIIWNDRFCDPELLSNHHWIAG
jgi:actin-related protein